MAKKAPRPRTRRRRRRPRARQWALLLLLTFAATCIALLVIGVFLVNTVTDFNADEMREMTAYASVVMPLLVIVAKIWELVIRNYLT
jgi:cell division protein FtsB